MGILYAPAIIAFFMLALFKVKSHEKNPTFYWLSIIVLTIIQTAFLSAAAQFGSIGRGGGTDNSASFLIILVIAVWLTLQIYYYQFKTRGNNSKHDKLAKFKRFK